MSHQLIFTKRSLKFLRALPVKHRAQIEECLSVLEKNPLPVGRKKLEGPERWFRIASGEYRIIYKYYSENHVVYISEIGKRNDGEVYRKFKRIMGN